MHTCKECAKVVKQDLTRGYGNFISHVTTMHKEDCMQKIRAFVDGAVFDPLDILVRKSSQKAINIFGWVEWIVMENLPISSCENRNFRKRTNLGVMKAKTIIV